MDRDAIARAQRRRQATDALAFERERAATLESRLHELVAELEGERVDEEAFGRMEAGDAELARAVLRPDGVEEAEADEDAWLIFGDEEPGEDEVDPREEAELEITRLQEEMAESRRRREALERYIAALNG